MGHFRLNGTGKGGHLSENWEADELIKLKSYIKEDITVLTYLKEVYLPELRETYIETLTNDNYMKQKVKIGEDQPGELVFHQTRLGFPATLLAVSLYEEALDKYRDFKKVEAS